MWGHVAQTNGKNPVPTATPMKRLGNKMSKRYCGSVPKLPMNNPMPIAPLDPYTVRTKRLPMRSAIRPAGGATTKAISGPVAVANPVVNTDQPHTLWISVGSGASQPKNAEAKKTEATFGTELASKPVEPEIEQRRRVL